MNEAPPQAQSQTQPQISQPTDPQAFNLARAIRQKETGDSPNPYNQKGASGEFGAYQFMPDTYKAYAQKYLGSADAPPTVENQNRIAYSFIKEKKDQGYNPAQIASMWNAGEGEPNAYQGTFKNGQPSKGVNRHGVSYDVPGYVSAVSNYYHQYTGQNAATGQNQPQATPDQTDQHASILGKILDFAFPIVHDVGSDLSGTSKKTALQQLGDLGLSALWFAPGVGDVAEGAIRGTGLLSEVGSKIAGQAVGGLGTGYAADVSSNLSQGDTNLGQVLTPGAGALTGGLLGGVLGKLGATYGEEGVLKDVAKSNNQTLSQWKSPARDVSEAFAQNQNPGRLMAEKGDNLASMWNKDSLSYDTEARANEYEADALKLNSVLSDALKSVPGKVSVSNLEAELLAKVPRNYPEQATIIKNEMNLLRQQYGEVVDASALNDWKQRNWTLSKFNHNDSSELSQQKIVHRKIGHTLKTKVEEIAKDGGLKGVKQYNEYVGQHMQAADLLHKIHGNKVKGGRLGDTILKHTMGAVGAGIGSGGLVSSILGFIAGEHVAPQISNLIRGVESNPLKQAILRRMVMEDPQIVQKVLRYARQTPKGIQAAKEAGVATEKVTPRIKSPKVQVKKPSPPSKRAGILGRTLLTGAVKTASQSQ